MKLAENPPEVLHWPEKRHVRNDYDWKLSKTLTFIVQVSGSVVQ